MKGSYTAPEETIGKVDSITKDDVVAVRIHDIGR